MSSLFVDLTYVFQEVSYQCYAVQSHALALFLIYFAYHYPWGWQNRDKLLRHPGPLRRRDRFVNRRSTSLASLAVLDTSRSEVSTADLDEALLKACPSATAAERTRFLTARKGNLAGATQMLTNYLQWNQKYVDVTTEFNITRPSTGDADLDIWHECCQVALRAAGETHQGPLPRVIRSHMQSDGKPLVDLQGNRLFQINPARMDVTLAKSSTYAVAVAWYLNVHMDRRELEKIVVCMDVRAGQGWPNTHVVRLVPFMQQTTSLLLSIFPERLHKCLVYPVPSSFMWVWNTISKVMDPLTRNKICVMSGPNKIVSPPPMEQMYHHIPKEASHHLEQARVAAFC
eukprot:Nitzschia sp. Nitz4//scaffold350_size17454//2505//3533//NITZ4_008816-RA/size17454-processed-gene-0.29-mRNA-1//1//CDS//3329548862//3054//frame0